jgi:hypothetical protein
MPLLLRSQGRQEIARSVYRDIYNENDYYYFFVSRTLEWTDEEDPEQPIDSVSYSNTSHRNTLFVKRIQANDAVLMAPRYNWALGTVYDQYDDAYGETDANDDPITSHSGVSTLSAALFYVVTDEYNVYKCISNGGDSESTVKPTGTDTNTFETSDGYVWKFMFRVEAGDVTKFLTATHIPVRKMAGLGEPQFDVNGFIDNISVTSGGSGYSTAPYVVIQGDGKTTPTVTIDSTTGQDASAFSICSTNGSSEDIVSSIIVTNGGTGYRSQVSKTFDGSSSAAVSVGSDTLSITAHGFTDLDLVTYSNGGGTSIGGLTNDRPYYVIYIGANTIKLATSYENADNAVAIDLTSLGTGSTHTLTFEGTTVSLLGGAGSGATASAVISSGVITEITVTDGGTGYAGARATAVLGSGGTADEVVSVTVNEPGSGFSFANINFVPVAGDTIDETATASAILGFTEGGTPQENVEAAATPGTIDRIVILSGGDSYITGDASISIIGDGQDAEATLTLTDGVVTDVTITNPGSGYSFAEISVVNAAEGSPGNGATFRAVLSPYGGHGSNPQKELFAKSLSLTVSLANETSDTFLNNDFRQLGIIKNPRIFGSSDNFTSNTGNCCYVIAINSPELVDYDDVITSDDGGRFIVVQKEDSNNNGVVDRIHLLPIIPRISSSSILTNETQEVSLGSPVEFNIGTVLVPDMVDYLEPEVDNRTGEIIYLDNRIKIIRTSDQVEKIRALINF